ncbi:MAG: hypothetical protein AB1599_00425 [Planctomycetota bacterium]
MHKPNKCRYCSVKELQKEKNKHEKKAFENVFPDILPALKGLACKYCNDLLPVYDPFSEVVYAAYQALKMGYHQKKDIIRIAANHLIRLARKESNHREFLIEHSEEIAEKFHHPYSYPPDYRLQDKYQWNYQGIQMLDEAVQDKVLSQIEVEVLAEYVCYERTFKWIAKGQNLTIQKVAQLYETALEKLKRSISDE